MKHVPIRLGPLALLLAVIAICLTILSVLSFTTGQADLRLAQRYADTVKERYALEAEGQQFYADVCSGNDLQSGLPVVTETLEGENGLSLTIKMRQNAQGSYDIVSWKFLRDWEENTDLDNIWTGE